MIDIDLYKRCPCCGTTEHLGEFVSYAKNGAILQFVACGLVRGARKRRPDGCHRSARPMEPGAYPDTGGGGLMDTMEDILADCNEVFRYDETRPQDRAHTYLKEHRVCRGYDDTAMERAAQDMIERAYTVGRMESSKAVARETARIIAEGIAKELGTTPGEEQTCDSR